MTDDETTTEQLAEIDGQAESTPTTEYTPPEGWRVLAVGERLRDGDVTVRRDGYQYPTERVGGWVGSNQRYIRPIEPKPEPEPPDGWQLVPLGEPLKGGDEYHAGLDRYIRRIKPEPEPQAEPEPEPVQVREGRWRTRSGEVKNIRSCEPLKGAYYVWPWTDGFMTFQDNGLHQGSRESPNDLVEYLGPIEQQPEPVPAVQGGLVRDVTHLLEESGVLDSAKAEQQIEELRSEVSYVQNLLGESRQRVTQLEELVGSLRTINRGCENAVRDAGKENTDLQHRLNVIAAEWAEQAETIRRLQIELDAAQQVPPAIADRFEEGWNQGTARAVETIAEWLQAFCGCNSPALALLLLEALPSIMRSLTGLTPED